MLLIVSVSVTISNAHRYYLKRHVAEGRKDVMAKEKRPIMEWYLEYLRTFATKYKKEREDGYEKSIGRKITGYQGD